MKKSMLAFIALIAAVAALQPLSCTKKNARIDGGEIHLTDTDIEKKYLTEGFITTDLFRVVIVTPKDTSPPELITIRNRAKNRALVSLERSLAEENIPSDRNMKAQILNIVEQNGQLARKEVAHSRYDVYYFNVTKKNLKNYLKNVSSQR